MKRTLLVLLALVAAAIPALADEVPSEAKVANEKPVVTGIVFTTPDDDAAESGMQVIPLPGETRTIALEARVKDDNGHADVKRVDLTVFARDNTTTLAGPTAAVLKDSRGRSGTWTASFEVPWWLPPGTYHLRVETGDKPGAKHLGHAKVTILETLAMSVGGSSIAFGDLAPGEVTAAYPLEIRNLGNLPIDLGVAATALASPDAAIPPNRIRAGLAANDATMALGLAPAPLSAFDLEAGPDSRRSVWFQLHVPTGDEQYVPQGDYRGTISVSAEVSG